LSTSPDGMKNVLNRAPTIPGGQDVGGMKNKNRKTRQLAPARDEDPKEKKMKKKKKSTTTEAARQRHEIRKMAELRRPE